MMPSYMFRGAIAAVIIPHTRVCAAKDKRPNIVYIMSDDHAYQAISAYGYRLNNTPNIDRMAKKEGAILPMPALPIRCAPSRAVLLYRQTQLYQWQD